MIMTIIFCANTNTMINRTRLKQPSAIITFEPKQHITKYWKYT